MQKLERGLYLKSRDHAARVHGGKLSYKAPDKRTSRCWNIRLTVAPHWVEILLKQGVKTNTWTRRQDTWHFKANLPYGPSSLRPVWHGISLTPIMKPKSHCLPGHCFLFHPSFPILPAEEHMSPITVLLSQHTIKVERQTLLLGPLALWSLSCFIWQIPLKIYTWFGQVLWPIYKIYKIYKIIKPVPILLHLNIYIGFQLFHIHLKK